jgi:AAA family ATP:ADP antiporter
MSSPAQFGKIRAFLWPIHSYELKKFLPLFVMFLFISFNYAFLRTSKDVLVTATGGADVLSPLKLWVVFPGAVLYMVYYSFILNKVNKENVFYLALLPFLVFFALFGFYFYPYRASLELQGMTDFCQSRFTPDFFKQMRPLINIIHYWPTTLYYLMAELWGSVALSLVFWSFTNNITSLEQAKRFYALLGIGANLGLTICGPFVKCLKNFTHNDYDQLLTILMMTFMMTTLIIIMIYYWMNRVVLRDPRLVDPAVLNYNKPKSNPALLESFNILFQSKHLIFIAIIVIAYGVTINLIEVIWKTQVIAYYDLSSVSLSQAQSGMQEFYSNTQTLTGLISIFCMLFISGQAERTLGWTFAALITPVALLLLGLIFFAVLMAAHYNTILYSDSLLKNSLWIIILIGAGQNAISKAAKYALFDPTKEKAYFPLDDDGRTKGKGAVDVIVHRLGKAGGAFIQQITLLFFGSTMACLPTLGLIVLLIIIVWILAVYQLGKRLTDYEKIMVAG